MANEVQDDVYIPGLLRSNSQKVADTYTGYRIDPKPNPLDSYLDYTYNISLYALSVDQYKTLNNNGPDAINLSENNLLIRSGGYPQGSVRNKYFADTDFSIEDLTIKQIIDPKGNQSAVGTNEITLRISEPATVTFIDRLYAAFKDIEPGLASYWQQNYLLVIKFYGYDEKGDVVNPQSTATSLNDPSVITRYLPFIISRFNFKVGAKLTEYNITGANLGTAIGLSLSKNIAPVHVEFTGTTLEELFNAQNPSSVEISQGNTGVNATPPNAGGVENKSTVYTTGLMRAINDQYKQLVTNQVINVADEFYLEFDTASELGASKIINWSEVASFNSTTNTKGLNPNTANATDAKAKRRWDITAGTSLTNFIQQAVLASDYVKKQEKQIIEVQNNTNNPAAGQGSNAEFKWLRIIVRTEPIAFDQKRNHYAYKTTYFVTDWRVTDPKAPSFPRNAFPGPHKLYQYSFTGKNTSILKWELDYNFQYFVSTNDYQVQNAVENPANKESVQKQPQIQNPSSKQGGPQKEVDIAASAADSLNNPADLAHNRMTIIGDPDLLFNEINDPGTLSVNEAFLPNGTVNVNAGQSYYVVFFNKSNDFDTNTGIVNFDYNPADLPNYSSKFAQAYFMVEVTSRFQRGRFEQDIHGVRLDTVDPLRAIVPGDSISNPDAGTSTPSEVSASTEQQQRAESDASPNASLGTLAPNFNVRQPQAITTAIDINQVPPVPTLLSGSTLTATDDAGAAVTEAATYPDFNAASRRRLYEAFNSSGAYDDLLKPNNVQEGEVNS